MSKATPPKVGKTVKDFFAELESQNKTVADWAREQNLDVNAVYAVTRGRVKGKRGDARQVLIAMGITPPAMFKAAATA